MFSKPVKLSVKFYKITSFNYRQTFFPIRQLLLLLSLLLSLNINHWWELRKVVQQICLQQFKPTSSTHSFVINHFQMNGTIIIPQTK